MVNKKLNYLIITILLILAASFLFIYKTAIYNQLDKWYLIPRPERFTELYFAEHGLLPQQALSGDVLEFSFAIHNLEGLETVYPYEVYFQERNSTSSVIIKEAVVNIRDNDTFINQISYQLDKEVGTSTVVVELTDKKQSIHFLLNY